MPVPGPHDKEPTAEIPGGLWRSYLEARRNREDWEAHEKHYRERVEKLIGDASAGTVGGVKVVSYRPAEKWSVTGIRKEYPEIAQHFVVTQTVENFDISAFVAQHPDLAEPFRSRSFRLVGDE